MKNSTRMLCRSGLLCAVMCVLSIISIPTGYIPFTGAVLGLFLCGTLLPPHYAFLSILAYIVLGAIGLPVFSGMNSGVGVLFGLTGGFLMAYPFTALITSLLTIQIRKKDRGFVANTVLGVLACIPGLIVCYLLGCIWFLHVKNGDSTFMAALTACVFPFIPFDLLKGLLAVLISQRIMRHNVQKM